MMVNKCIAPGCEAGYDSSDKKTVISTFRFPADGSRRKIWTSRVPRLNWTPSNNSVLCEKHFEESCFKTERNDIKNDRRKQRKGELQRKESAYDHLLSWGFICPVPKIYLMKAIKLR